MSTVRVLAAWGATRLLLVWAALSPWFGEGTGTIRPWSDVRLFEGYARAIADGAVPYVDVAVEYPVAALPLVLAPLAVPGVAYLTGFVLLALALDAAGLAATRRLADLWGGHLGPWTWVVGPVLLGPVALLRLDLLPVVAVLWAVERAARDRWEGTGALLVVGGAAKLWPGGLLPAALVAGGRRRGTRVVAGTVVAALLLGATAWQVLPAMLDSAVLRNLDRGLQVETLWSSLLLAADVAGLVDTSTRYAAGADQVEAIGATPLLWCARIVPLLAVGLGAWLARRGTGREPARQYAHAAESATLVLVAGAAVLSAQFLLWAIGAVAAVASTGATRVRRRVVLVGAAAALTALGFPWLYEGLKAAEPLPVAVLLLRNVLLVAAAVDAVRDANAQRRGRLGGLRSGPGTTSTGS